MYGALRLIIAIDPPAVARLHDFMMPFVTSIAKQINRLFFFSSKASYSSDLSYEAQCMFHLIERYASPPSLPHFPREEKRNVWRKTTFRHIYLHC
jgi:hypothetical protein